MCAGLQRVILVVLALVCAPWASVRAADLDVMTYNIRCGRCEQPTDPDHWSRRKALVAGVVRRQRPDLLGLQEAERFQVTDLAALLADYDWIAVGRDDGAEQGEANAILYRRSRFERITDATRWLSPTPERIGKGWDAAFNRTVSYVRLRDRHDGREIVLFNTHFDHMGQQARLGSSQLVTQLVASVAGSTPVIVTGDFNMTRDNPAYAVMAGALQDAQCVSRRRSRGGTVTFNDFGRSPMPGNTIDYIFVGPGIQVLSHRIVTDRPGGRYPSDHYPVQARLRLPAVR